MLLAASNRLHPADQVPPLGARVVQVGERIDDVLLLGVVIGKHQEQLANTVAAVKAAGASAKETRRALDEICKLTDRAKQLVDKLQDLLEHEGNGEAEKHAKYFRDKVIPAMTALREVGDALEQIVPQTLWPLPTYREMLFVK